MRSFWHPWRAGETLQRPGTAARTREAAPLGVPWTAAVSRTASDRSPPFATNYVPEVLGVKVFSARDEQDLEPYFSASGGRSVSADAMFDEAEAMFDRLPDGEPVFSRDTPVVVTVVMFDCRPAGNIRLEGTTRLIDETVPGDPFLTYERPFSIMRRQEGSGFTISTSSGRGCMDNLNAGAPSGGWAPGPYRVEYRDASGDLLVAVPFEVTTIPRQPQLRLPIDLGMAALAPTGLFRTQAVAANCRFGSTFNWTAIAREPASR